MYTTYTYTPSTYSSYYTTTTSSAASGAAVGGLVGAILAMGVIFWLVCIALVVLTIVGQWKMFKKAGKAPWDCLIAGHNQIVLMDMGGIESKWFFISLIPFGAIFLMFWTNIAVAKAFGKGAGFGVLATFFPFICFPILGLGSAEYVGPQKETSSTAPSSDTYNK